MDKVAKEMHQRDLSVWIMPEGTRSNGRGILPFKRGAFYLAKMAEVPIIPIVVSDFKNLNFRKLNSGTITIKVLEPEFSPEDIYEWKDQLEAKFRAEFDKISNTQDDKTV